MEHAHQSKTPAQTPFVENDQDDDTHGDDKINKPLV